MAQIKLAWDYDSVAIPECAKFSVYKSKADGTTDWIARIAQTTNAAAPSDTSPLMISLPSGNYKLWVYPVNSTNDTIAEGASIDVVVVNPPVTNLRQVF